MTPDHVEQAASWQARLLSDRCSAQDRQGFSEWLRQDEAHHHAYDLVSQIWKSGSFDHAPRSPAVTRRRVLGAMAALGATVLTTSPSADAGTIRTGRGATRHVAFGAIQTDMDACSTLMHAPESCASGFGPAVQGGLAFGEGRYALSITRAATRQTFHCGSWRVEGGAGRYAIDIAPQAMKIAVLAGGLRLTHPHYPALSLIENQVLVVDGRAGHIERQSMRMDDILAWREGRAVFRDTPLDRALSEMARYTDRPVTLLSPALGGLHISGVFHTRDPRRFALRQLQCERRPVQAQLRPHGRHVASFGLLYDDHKGPYASIIGKFVGNHWGLDSTTDSAGKTVFANRYRIGSTTTADLALGWHFRKLGGHMRDVTPSLNILNLFNNRAVSDFAGNQSAASAGYPDGAPLYWRLAGRSVFFNLTVTLP